MPPKCCRAQTVQASHRHSKRTRAKRVTIENGPHSQKDEYHQRSYIHRDNIKEETRLTYAYFTVSMTVLILKYYSQPTINFCCYAKHQLIRCNSPNPPVGSLFFHCNCPVIVNPLSCSLGVLMYLNDLFIYVQLFYSPVPLIGYIKPKVLI